MARSATEPLKSYTPRAAFDAGTMIFREGDKGDKAYIVEDGEVKIVANGKILGLIQAGGIFGEMALVDGKPRMADAIASRHTKLLVVEREAFRQKFEGTDPFMRAVIRILVNNIRSMVPEK